MLARRFPGLRVLGIDISEAMVEAARAKVPPELADRVDLRVADAAEVPSGDAEFDLVILVNAPVFFGEIARVLQPGGHAAVVSSLGTRTPFHTPAKLLDRGFRRAGMERVERGQAGAGLYYVARKD